MFRSVFCVLLLFADAWAATYPSCDTAGTLCVQLNASDCNSVSSCRAVSPGCNMLSAPFNISCFPTSWVGNMHYESYSPCFYNEGKPSSPIIIPGTTRQADILHPHPLYYMDIGTATTDPSTAQSPSSSDAPCLANTNTNTSNPFPPYRLAISPDTFNPSIPPCYIWSVVASYWLNVSDCIKARELYGWEFSLCPRNTTRMTYDTNIDPINVNETTPYVCVYTPSIPCTYRVIELNGWPSTHQAYSSCPTWPSSSSSASGNNSSTGATIIPSASSSTSSSSSSPTTPNTSISSDSSTATSTNTSLSSSFFASSSSSSSPFDGTTVVSSGSSSSRRTNNSQTSSSTTIPTGAVSSTGATVSGAMKTTFWSFYVGIVLVGIQGLIKFIC